MARKALGTNALAVVAAVKPVLVNKLHRRSTVHVACSGGPDSLALAAAVAWVQQHHPDPLREVGAVVVDHGLQDGSAAVAAQAAAQVTALGVPTTVTRVQVNLVGDGVEAAAREARYAALRAASPDMVLLGHTLDDQAETVLLGLARGSGTRSLAGMPARFGNQPEFVRPLLKLRRCVTVAACSEFGLTAWHDPQNVDIRFLRSRIRTELLPHLTTVLGDSVIPALARTAELARADADRLDQETAALLPTIIQPDGSLAIPPLAALPEPLQSRAVRQWLATYELTEVSFEHTQAILALVNNWHGQGLCHLPGGAVLRHAMALVYRSEYLS
ncbi:MAG: tRNA lysidine(34) synthetase TilS [Propionibacteriaceae bacterium]|jgi:tRNA(Ile)-lysidine synthase|nr:tRNA lysidine(34) synthetase TilS [Propionibacteriaceae bacterium]